MLKLMDLADCGRTAPVTKVPPLNLQPTILRHAVTQTGNIDDPSSVSSSQPDTQRGDADSNLDSSYRVKLMSPLKEDI